MRAALFDTLDKTGGLKIPLYPLRGGQMRLRNPAGSGAASFPPALTAPPKRP